MRWQQRIAIGLLLAIGGTHATAQALAHKNWAGSGLAVAPWWVGAELYSLDPISFQDSNGDGFGDLNGIADRLDYLTALGIDAIVLSPMPVQPGGLPFDKAYGTEDDFGRLVEQATKRKLRMLVDLPLSADRSTSDTLGAARFWLTRGVAGLRLVNGIGSLALGWPQRAERVRALRRLCGEFAGQRVLLGESEVSTGQPRAARRDLQPVELVLERGPGDAGIHAGPLRTALLAAERVAGEASTPVLVSDGADEPRSIERLGDTHDPQHDLARARIMAAVLLGSRGAPMLYFGQELGMSGTLPAPMQWGRQKGFTTGIPWIETGPNADTANVAVEDPDPDSLLNWYRKLGALRHANPALHQGTEEMLQPGDQDAVAWMRRARLGQGEAPDVVVIVNCSARFVSVSVEAGVGPRVLRTLAATYAADAAVSTRAIAVAPFGVFVGEVQRRAGLENTPDPLRRHR